MQKHLRNHKKQRERNKMKMQQREPTDEIQLLMNPSTRTNYLVSTVVQKILMMII